MHVAAIIAAGGRGLRLSADRPKQFLDLGGGSILDLSVAALSASDRISEIVVALPSDHLAQTAASWAGRSSKPLAFVSGGARRQDSVANAFARTSERADVILVHDAARPFVTAAIIARTVAAAAAHGAAIAAMPVHDTVKQAGSVNADGSRVIRVTLPRDEIYLAQTPQAFRRDVFVHMLEAVGHLEVTDEAMLAERAGVAVHIVEGDSGNIKVTTAEDLAEARNRAEGRDFGSGRTPLRVGTGYDLHRLIAGRPLILAGVTIPFDLGLEGHSDADIVCHAVTDAVLGAAAAGDIGRLFPDTDPQWEGADSLALLRGAMTHISALGYRVSNVDITVITQKPKLLSYLDQMRANLATALQVDPSAVSIKGKTNEGVDSMGRGESMACHAVALLSRA